MACDLFARKTQKHIKHIGCLPWLEVELEYLLITKKHAKHIGCDLKFVWKKNTKTRVTHGQLCARVCRDEKHKNIQNTCAILISLFGWRKNTKTHKNLSGATRNLTNLLLLYVSNSVVMCSRTYIYIHFRGKKHKNTCSLNNFFPQRSK